MNNPTADFEEWLNSLGFDDSSTENHTQAEQVAIANGDLPPEPLARVDALTVHEDVPTPEIQPLSFSEEDMDSLLAENGFAEPQEDEAEETQNNVEDVDFEEDGDEGDTTEEYDENGVEGRNSFEENADFQEAVDSGEVVPVMEADIQRIDSEAPSTPEEAMAYPNREPLLPENSPTVSIDESTSRFSGTEWYDEMLTKTIMIAGCGGIGSWLSFLIARLKPYSITLYDDDTVELANMSGQLFKRADIGKSKVSTVHDMIFDYTSMYNVRALPQKFTASTPPTDIMMCGFDSMRARKIYYDAWKIRVAEIREDKRKNCFFMDGRLTVDTLQVFCLTGEDTYNMERYEREFLFDDSQADSVVCSQKQTTYLACMIGSIMTNLFINWVANNLDPIIPYKLPFFTQYEAQHMIFKTEE